LLIEPNQVTPKATLARCRWFQLLSVTVAGVRHHTNNSTS